MYQKKWKKIINYIFRVTIWCSKLNILMRSKTLFVGDRLLFVIIPKENNIENIAFEALFGIYHDSGSFRAFCLETVNFN